jgi:uncharacterized protein YcbX
VRVAALWRYPVKSVQGEPLAVAELTATGIAGDRRWAVADAETGTILSAKRVGRLLMASARTTDPVTITLPDGTELHGPGPRTDDALSSWLERPVRLVGQTDAVPTFERQADDTDDHSPTITWTGRPGSFVDSSHLHLLTTASLRVASRQRPDLDWSPRRFRPNVLLDVGAEDHPGSPGDGRVEDGRIEDSRVEDGWIEDCWIEDGRVEDGWIGDRLRLGTAEVIVTKPCRRCVMVTRPQPSGLELQRDVLAHLAATAENALGVRADVHLIGHVAVGDTAVLSPPSPPS